MFSKTRRALEDFDNQHDFERLAADVLNGLGYSDVEPMAPGGGADGGTDVKFREGETPGIAFVTLDKKIKEKFKEDLEKHGDAEGVIALFCNVDLTPATKLAFAKDALSKGYRLLPFDLERLRSLLDSSLKEIRRRYLHIDDEASAKLRSEVRKLLKYPDAASDDSEPSTSLEKMLFNKLPYRLFNLLMRYEEEDIREMPGIGKNLEKHVQRYYQFRQQALAFENELMLRAGAIVGDCFNSRTVWQMYCGYALPRFFGITREEIISWGNSLNYGVTWESTEKVYEQLSQQSALISRVEELKGMVASMNESISALGDEPLHEVQSGHSDKSPS